MLIIHTERKKKEIDSGDTSSYCDQAVLKR